MPSLFMPGSMKGGSRCVRRARTVRANTLLTAPKKAPALWACFGEAPFPENLNSRASVELALLYPEPINLTYPGARPCASDDMETFAHCTPNGWHIGNLAQVRKRLAHYKTSGASVDGFLFIAT